MKRIRILIGLFLIVCAIAGLIYWEVNGRERVLMDQLLVAKDTILSGTLVTSDMFIETGVLEENKIEGALDRESLPYIIGKVANQRIIKNGQISRRYFTEEKFHLNDGESLFKIKPEWISSCSSSLRRGDFVDIYGGIDPIRIGTYRVAFVKDENYVEVKDSQGGNSSILERIDSTSIISHIEVITDLSGYEKILKEAKDVTSTGLLLVQREEPLN